MTQEQVEKEIIYAQLTIFERDDQIHENYLKFLKERIKELNVIRKKKMKEAIEETKKEKLKEEMNKNQNKKSLKNEIDKTKEKAKFVALHSYDYRVIFLFDLNYYYYRIMKHIVNFVKLMKLEGKSLEIKKKQEN